MHSSCVDKEISVRGRTIARFITLAIALLVAPLLVAAEKPTRLPRIGYLRGGSTADAIRDGEALRQGLRDFGYIEGQNLMIETRVAEGHYDRLPDLAAELVRLSVDVIVAGGTVAITAARNATSTIPIVMAVSSDPVGAGLVASLARPGGNVTGVSLASGDQFAGKWVELLKEAVPQVSRVAVLWDPTTASILRPIVQETEHAARAVGFQLHLLEARKATEIEPAFAAMTSVGAQALIVLPAARFYAERERIVGLAATHRLPAMYEHREFVGVGGLMSYGPNLQALLRRAAYYVDRILEGTKPTDLPVEEPRTFELVINLKTAQALGLTLSPVFLFRADEVLQ
jgi:putative ABC transport system substrate-binding protein